MKFLSVIVLAGAIMITTSCNKEEDKKESDNETDFYFTCKIDGEMFSADMTEHAYYGVEGAQKHHGMLLTVIAVKDVSNVALGNFLLNIGYTGTPGSVTVGVGTTNNSYARYQFGSIGTGGSWAAEKGSSSLSNDVGTGTVTVTYDKDGVVKGTFEFTGYNNDDATTKNITEGKFRLKVKE